MEKNDGQYFIQDIPVLSICKKYGTPLYLYDTAIMKRQYEKLTQAFQGVNLKINYACKALSNLNVLRYFKAWEPD